MSDGIGVEDRIHAPTLALLYKVSETLKLSTSAMNEIIQFAESYLTKAGIIQAKLRVLELSDITTFATNLKQHSQLSSGDTANVITAWLEARTVERVNRMANATRTIESVTGSVRILFANTSVLDAIKAVMSRAAKSGGEEEKN